MRACLVRCSRSRAGTRHPCSPPTTGRNPSWRPGRNGGPTGKSSPTGLTWRLGAPALPSPLSRGGRSWGACGGMQVFPDVAEALGQLASFGWRLAVLTNCDDDLFAATSASLPVPFDVVVTAEQVRSYKPDLGHFRRFAEITGATPANWIHVANSWVHDILPAARMGLRSVWVDRDHTGHPAKFAERRVTSMRRLAETVTDVSVLPAWPARLLAGDPRCR